MKAITQKWVDRAEEDWTSLNGLLRLRKSANFNNVCFFTQQCIEKYLKARLIEAAIVFPKTHDLLALLALVLPVEPLWSVLEPALLALNPYAVAIRYPDDLATREDAKEARKICAEVRAFIRPALRLSDNVDSE